MFCALDITRLDEQLEMILANAPETTESKVDVEAKLLQVLDNWRARTREINKVLYGSTRREQVANTDA